MLTIEKLKAYGADTDEGMKRCLNDESFYFRLIQSIIPDTRIDELAKQIEDGDLDAAFDTAHALKGMYGNLALTPIVKPISEMTELLRIRTNTDYTALITEALEQKKKLNGLMD